MWGVVLGRAVLIYSLVEACRRFSEPCFSGSSYKEGQRGGISLWLFGSAYSAYPNIALLTGEHQSRRRRPDQPVHLHPS